METIFATKLPQPADRRFIDFDDDEELHSELDHLISQYAGGHCSSIEFFDTDYPGPGKRDFVYSVETQIKNGRYDRDEDSAYADTDKHREKIRVTVTDSMNLDLIARCIAAEVRGIEDNAFA